MKYQQILLSGIGLSGIAGFASVMSTNNQTNYSVEQMSDFQQAIHESFEEPTSYEFTMPYPEDIKTMFHAIPVKRQAAYTPAQKQKGCSYPKTPRKLGLSNNNTLDSRIQTHYRLRSARRNKAI